MYVNNPNTRHVAISEASYGIILGFEDTPELGDQDYDDGFFLYFFLSFFRKHLIPQLNSSVFIIYEVVVLLARLFYSLILDFN